MLKTVIRCWFVFFISLCVIFVWATCQQVLGAQSCHLCCGTIHFSWYALCWVEQACKVAYSLLADFLHSLKTAKSETVISWCHVRLMPHSNPWMFWDVQWSCLEFHVMLYPSFPLFAYMPCCSLSLSCSQIAIKCFYQAVNIKFSFAMWIASVLCILWPCSCHE